MTTQKPRKSRKKVTKEETMTTEKEVMPVEETPVEPKEDVMQEDVAPVEEPVVEPAKEEVVEPAPEEPVVEPAEDDVTPVEEPAMDEESDEPDEEEMEEPEPEVGLGKGGCICVDYEGQDFSCPICPPTQECPNCHCVGTDEAVAGEATPPVVHYRCLICGFSYERNMVTGEYI